MSTKQYSKALEGNSKISSHFRVGEFACRDGSDKILVDDALLTVLEEIRMRCGRRPVRVNSGFRTPAYNRLIGGASESYHMKGMAADITVSGLTPPEVASAAELALYKNGWSGGLGCYPTFLHVDTRPVKWRQNMVNGDIVRGFGPSVYPTLVRGSGDALYVGILQNGLIRVGLDVAADGIFGRQTEAAVKNFQTKRGLTPDGAVGPITWCELSL